MSGISDNGTDVNLEDDSSDTSSPSLSRISKDLGNGSARILRSSLYALTVSIVNEINIIPINIAATINKILIIVFIFFDNLNFGNFVFGDSITSFHHPLTSLIIIIN